MPQHSVTLPRMRNYQLLDFGRGRKLEAFSGYVVDRPCPAAAGVAPREPAAWQQAAARFDREAGGWSFRRAWPESLALDCGTFRLPLRPTPYGHVGAFPEQAPNWRWLAGFVADQPAPPAALNLFAYTGGSTMALAAAGARVAHVDAARPNVGAARRAAEVSGLAEAPIRYLVEDARKFLAREQRRGRRYQLIVLDPPAYGHGPSGKAWRLERDLWPLLGDCLALASGAEAALIVTGHSPHVAAADVRRWLADRLGGMRELRAAPAVLRDRAGRALDAGFRVRVRWNPPS